jgi:hypothetical protein
MRIGNYLFFLNVFFSLVAATSFADANKSLREKLIANEKVTQVITIDDHLTHVFPVIDAFGFNSGDINQDFTNFLKNSCDTKWEIKDIDPITGKDYWVPYDGKSNLYSRTVKDPASKGNKVFNGARCVDKFEIVKVFGGWRSLFSDGTGRFFSPTNFIIKHKEVQPFVYKNRNVPTAKDVEALPPGEIKTLTPKVERGFFKRLINLDKPSSADLYQYGVVLCKISGGTQRIVVNTINKYGEKNLAEVDMLNGYTHVFSEEYKKGLLKEWYFACEGTTAFVIREKENITYDNKNQPISSTIAIYAPNRGLEGVDFIKLK